MRTFHDLRLDRFQEEAIDGIRGGSNVIVAAPTGCGKTLIAEYAIEQALEEGLRVAYTSPIKALSNQKFRDFGRRYGDKVGIMTGDVTINPSAQALIMTTEIFRNTIFESPERLEGTRYVILDEVHYMDDPDRGTVWEEAIMFAPASIRLLCLSATIQNLDQFAGWIRKVREGRLKLVVEKNRPVPLEVSVFNGADVIDPAGVRGARFPSPDKTKKRGRGRADGRRRGKKLSIPQQNKRLVDLLVRKEHLPCIFFIFSRAYVQRMAESCIDLDGLVDDDERKALVTHVAELAREFELDFEEPGAARLRRLLERGIAYHHAGMLPTLKEVVERLFTTGLLKLLFATETFALGVNMPARAVAFETLRKFDGVKVDYMPTRSFLQMAGRAGRRGIDERGHVYANVFPDLDDARDVRRVLFGAVEDVGSQFRLSYATLLKLYHHLGDGIYEACERSFAYFRHKRKKGAYYLEMVSLIQRRLGLLRSQGYLEGRELTPRGRFCASIFGYEVELTELFFGGLIERLTPPELAVLLTSVVYEARRDAWYTSLARSVMHPLMRDAHELLEPFRRAELALKLPPVKKLDWSLSRIVFEWAHGAEFQVVTEMSDADPGDVIRALRMVVQLIRQLRSGVRTLDAPRAHVEDLERLLFETTACVRRGEVDAEKLLRQSVHMDGGKARPGGAARGGHARTAPPVSVDE